jgi:hypothetical protein
MFCAKKVTNLPDLTVHSTCILYVHARYMISSFNTKKEKQFWTFLESLFEIPGSCYKDLKKLKHFTYYEYFFSETKLFPKNISFWVSCMLRGKTFVHLCSPNNDFTWATWQEQVGLA